MSFIKVSMPLEVPAGKHCSQGGMNSCEHLDVQGYKTGCNRGMGRPEEDAKGWDLKPEKCLNLVQIQ